MKKYIVLVAILLLTACGPSQEELQATVQASIAETQAAMPTETHEPTATPNPTDTPEPTNTPRPTNTSTPRPTFTPVPTPIVFSGSGDTVIDVEKWAGAAILQIEYTGSRNFIVWNYGSNNEAINLLVNTIGNYKGTRPLDFHDGEYTTRLVIEGTGQWKVEILPFEKIRTVSVPGIIEGEGDDVVALAGNNNQTTDTLSIDATRASRNFIVYGIGNSYELLVNEIAPYSGKVLVPGDLPVGTFLVLIIEAKGPWSIEVATR